MKEDIDLYSNPKIVYQKAKSIFGNNIDIKLSTRKDKKYMILNDDNKWVHFGEMGYEDYTKHNDIERLINFKKRNSKWKNANKYSPAFLSYFLLW